MIGVLATLWWSVAQATPTPPDALYFVLVDRFADGRQDPAHPVDPTDPQAWHGGDLAGLLAHYDEIPGGGLWLSPIQAARTEPIGKWGAFHGYWTTDLHALEPRLATDAELMALSKRLDDDGKELWLDLVTNHVGYDAPLIAEKPDWFHHNGDITDWNDSVEVVTHDVHGLPDLAVEKPEVYAHILGAATHWVKVANPTGFRVDAVRHLPEGFLAKLRADLRKVDPELQLLGEFFEGDPEKLAARQRVDQLDRVFDFPLHYALKDAMCGGDLGRLAAVIGQDDAYDDPSSLVTFLDNHDVARIRSVCGGDVDRVARTLAVLTTVRGTPCITWGTEAGLDGAEEPANRADMVFEPQPLRASLDALLDLRTTHEALGREAPTRVLAVDRQRVVLARRAKGQTAALVVTGDASTTWPLAELGSDCRGWVVTDARGPRPLPAVGALPVPPSAVGIAVCGGEPSGAVARAFGPEQPAVPVRLEVPDDKVLVGSGERLGRWDPGKGLSQSTALQVPPGTVLQYKLVGRDGDAWVWPDGGNMVRLVPW